MFKLFDRVKINIATTGTGDVTFGSASSNAFLTPTEAGAADADTVRYVIVDGTDYEEGIGTIKSSVAAMERTTVTVSKIGGTAGTTKLDLSGTAVLSLNVAAADLLLTSNNLADLDDAPTALTNLGGTTVGKALFTATDAAAARVALACKFGQCVLGKSGSNVVLSPKNGNLLTISGGTYAVPTSGVSLAPTGLTVGTLYYIYAYMNSGTMTLEASTTGHSTSSTAGNEGVEIKTGDDTRSLVGMGRVVTGPAWSDAIAQRFVRSWFNDFSQICAGSFTTNRSATGSGEVNSEIRNEFLLWAGEKAMSSITGFAFHGTTAVDVITGIAFNGTTREIGASAFDESTAGYFQPVCAAIGKSGLTEGYNFATLVTSVASGTATYASGTALSSHITR